MSPVPMEELRQEVLRIEQSIDDKTYEPGPWAAVLRKIRKHPPAERRHVSEEVSRVSDKLHQHNWSRRTVRVRTAVIMEIVVAMASLDGIYLGLRWDSIVLVMVSAWLLSWAAQPLFKMAVGTALGVRYSYFHLKYMVEPRAKIKYGTYLALPWSQQALFHASGMVGSIATMFILSAVLAEPMPAASTYTWYIGLLFLAMNVTLFVGGLFGVKYFVKLSSGGQAANLLVKNLKGSPS